LSGKIVSGFQDPRYSGFLVYCPENLQERFDFGNNLVVEALEARKELVHSSLAFSRMCSKAVPNRGHNIFNKSLTVLSLLSV
jgi:hypothetical protein